MAPRCLICGKPIRGERPLYNAKLNAFCHPSCCPTRNPDAEPREFCYECPVFKRYAEARLVVRLEKYGFLAAILRHVEKRLGQGDAETLRKKLRDYIQLALVLAYQEGYDHGYTDCDNE